MPLFTIKNTTTGHIIFQGDFPSARACVENAAADRIPLHGADLRHLNLSGAMLDGADLSGALLDHANLGGANLSEALLDHASLRHVCLHGACLCFSRITHCDLRGASFGATDIAGSVMDGSLFCAFALSGLNFIDAESLAGCMVETDRAAWLAFSKPPVTLSGLSYPVTVFDEHVRIGPSFFSFDDWRIYTNDNHIPRDRANQTPPSRLYQFIATNRALLDTLIGVRTPIHSIRFQASS